MVESQRKEGPKRRGAPIWLVGLLILALPPAASTQTAVATVSSSPTGQSRTNLTTAEDMNQRLQELLVRATAPEVGTVPSLQDYRIGANDLLAIKVFEASELGLEVRVSAGGEIALPLIGVVVAANLTPRELELVLEELLRRDFIKNPHVSVHVEEMESHAVSVVGAVNQPGVVQIRGSLSLLEVLALAGGLAPDAGSTVQVVRKSAPGSGQTQTVMQETGGVQLALGPGNSASPALGTLTNEVLEIDLKTLLLESEDQRHNVLIHPGDMVTVLQAELVYVVGEVRRPGGFPITSNGPLTILGALALGEGFTPAAAQGDTVIIRTDSNGHRSRISVNLTQVLKGKTPDISLQAKDIVFVPSSTSKAIARASADVLFRMLTFRAVVF